MKAWLVLAAILATWSAGAQTNSPPQTNAAPGALQLQLPSKHEESVFTLQEPKPNELLKGNVVFSGSAVEVVKTRKPLQLLNPLAPPQYGSPEDNVARDPINNRVYGLKLFAIHF